MTFMKLICWFFGHRWKLDLEWGEGRMETCARCEKVRVERNVTGAPPSELWDVP